MIQKSIPIEYVTRDGKLTIAYAQCKTSDLKLVFATDTARKRKYNLIIHFENIISDLSNVPEIETIVEETKLTEEKKSQYYQ